MSIMMSGMLWLNRNFHVSVRMGTGLILRSLTLLDGQGLDAEIAHLTSFPLAADFGQILPFPSLSQSIGFILTPNCFEKR